MPLEVPPIDDRSYRELLDDVLARIAVHTPEWTNRNDDDPGVTLLQLFAYLGESVLYRASLIPERNRLAFLRLLGHDRRPASAARGVVAFDHLKGGRTTPVLEPGTPVRAGNVPFRTDAGLAVLPLEAVAFVKRRTTPPVDEEAALQDQFAAFLDPGTEPAFYLTTAVDWGDPAQVPVDLGDTVDGALWLALLAPSRLGPDDVRAAVGGRVLTIGVVPDVDVDRRTLPPVGTDVRGPAPQLEFHVPDAATPLATDPAARRAAYVPLPARATGDVLRTTGLVELELPAPGGLRMWALEPAEEGVGDFPPALEPADADRLVTWVRIRPVVGDGDASAALAAVRLRWLGGNAATIRQQVHVATEPVGLGTGRGDQRLQLANTPVLADTLRLTVGGVPWREVEDLATADPEVPLPAAPVRADDVDRASVFTLDRATGELAFGDGIHGRRPPAGAVVQARYDHGGGVAGMVAADAVTTGPTLPPGIRVRNPIPTWGGAEAEDVERAEQSIAGHVRHRDRLVTAVDVEEVAARTHGVRLGRVEVLPSFDPDLDVAAPGAVTVLVVPERDPRDPAHPAPDRHVLEAVCAHLDERRLVTTELHVTGPAYRSVWVSVGVDVLGGHALAVVRDDVATALRTFLSPLAGGHLGQGWPLRTPVERLELWARAARVDGVAKVTGVLLAGDDGTDADRVPVDGVQLPRLVAVAVRGGTPAPLDGLRGAAPEPPPTLPVPHVPAVC